MLSSIINLKFPSTAEAKIEASHFSEISGSKISYHEYLGIQITIGKSGELSIGVRFDEAVRLKKFESDIPTCYQILKSPLFIRKKNIQVFASIVLRGKHKIQLLIFQLEKRLISGGIFFSISLSLFKSENQNMCGLLFFLTQFNKGY